VVVRGRSRVSRRRAGRGSPRSLRRTHRSPPQARRLRCHLPAARDSGRDVCVMAHRTHRPRWHRPSQRHQLGDRCTDAPAARHPSFCDGGGAANRRLARAAGGSADRQRVDHLRPVRVRCGSRRCELGDPHAACRVDRTRGTGARGLRFPRPGARGRRSPARARARHLPRRDCSSRRTSQSVLRHEPRCREGRAAAHHPVPLARG